MVTKGGYLISRIKQTGTRIFDRMLAESGIEAFNGAQGRILYVLWQQDGITISELSAKTSLANTTLTSMLDRMEESGLLERRADAKDRRSRRIGLTDRARAMQREYDGISGRMSEVYYAGFTQEEIARFEADLQRVLNNLMEEESR